jgi:hypothetical protein
VSASPAWDGVFACACAPRFRAPRHASPQGQKVKNQNTKRNNVGSRQIGISSFQSAPFALETTAAAVLSLPLDRRAGSRVVEPPPAAGGGSRQSRDGKATTWAGPTLDASMMRRFLVWPQTHRKSNPAQMQGALPALAPLPLWASSSKIPKEPNTCSVAARVCTRCIQCFVFRHTATPLPPPRFSLHGGLFSDASHQRKVPRCERSIHGRLPQRNWCGAGNNRLARKELYPYFEVHVSGLCATKRQNRECLPGEGNSKQRGFPWKPTTPSIIHVAW